MPQLVGPPQCATGQMRGQHGAVGSRRTDRSGRIDGPRHVGLLVARDHLGRLCQRAAVRNGRGTYGLGERGGKLDSGQALVAKTRIAACRVPALRSGEPGG